MNRTKRTQTTGQALTSRWKTTWYEWWMDRCELPDVEHVGALTDCLDEQYVGDREKAFHVAAPDTLALLGLPPVPASLDAECRTWCEVVFTAMPFDDDEAEEDMDEHYEPTADELTRWPHLLPPPPDEPPGLLAAALERSRGLTTEDEMDDADAAAIIVARMLLFARHVRDTLDGDTLTQTEDDR